MLYSIAVLESPKTGIVCPPYAADAAPLGGSRRPQHWSRSRGAGGGDRGDGDDGGDLGGDLDLARAARMSGAGLAGDKHGGRPERYADMSARDHGLEEQFGH